MKKLISFTTKALRLHKIAMGEGYGYKYANLIELRDAANLINPRLTKIRLNVPEPEGLKTSEVTSILKRMPSPDKSAPHLWAWICQQWRSILVEPIESLSETQVSRLTELQAKIEASFADPSLVDWLGHHPLFTQINTYLATLGPDKHTILRSTGKEDSDEDSNAGGNLSVAYVPPEIQMTIKTLGRVIGSYFGPRSVSQRLLADAPSLFSAEAPFVPVLLQEMVGDGDSISGVMFTEPITRINAAVGNNEGVVSGKVAVSTYLISNSRSAQVHCVRRKQSEKFAAVRHADSHVTLEKVPTTAEEATQRRIPDDILKEMQIVSAEIAAYYGRLEGKSHKDMDVEFTIDFHANGTATCHLLQARPLLKTQDNAPSYLHKDAYSSPECTHIQTDIVLPGRCQVNTLHPKTVLIESNIHVALKRFQKAPNRKEIQLILVKAMPPDNSHAAVVLRPSGVTVLCIPDDTHFEEWRLRLQKPCILDSQRGRLLSGVSDVAPFVTPGYTTYPITPHVSFGETGHSPESAIQYINAQIKRYLNVEIRNTTLKLLSLGELIEQLKFISTGDPIGSEILTIIYTKLTRQLNDEMKILGHKPHLSGPILDFICIMTHLTDMIPELMEGLSTTQPATLARLFPIKILEIAIFGGDAQRRILDSKSIKLVLQELKVDQRVDSDRSPGTSTDSVRFQLEKFKLMIINSEYTEQWTNLIQTLPEAHIEEFCKICLGYQELGILSDWINILFSKSVEPGPFTAGSATQFFTEIRHEFVRGRSTFATIKACNLAATQLESDYPEFEQPQKLGHAVEKLNLYFETHLFHLIAHFGRSDQSNLSWLALVKLMARSIELIDGAIKRMKGSPDLNVPTKISEMTHLLSLYRELVGKLGVLIPVSEQAVLFRHNNTDNEDCAVKSIPEFLDLFDQGVMVSPNFNVSPGFRHLSDVLLGRSSPKESVDLSFYDCGHVPGKPARVTRRPSKQSLVEIFENSFRDLKEDAPLVDEWQLSQSPQFNISACMINNGMDVTDSVQWPVTLEDHFTFLHQNSIQILAALNKKIGVSIAVLPEWMKVIAEIFSQLSPTISLSDIRLEAPAFSVIFNQPLGAHAAKIIFRCDPRLDSDLLTMTVTFAGGDERRRWDIVAGLGAVLGASPKIDYNRPTGVEWTLPIRLDREDIDPHFRYLMWTLNQIFAATMSDFCVIEQFPVLIYLLQKQINFTQYKMETALRNWRDEIDTTKLPDKFLEQAPIFAHDWIGLCAYRGDQEQLIGSCLSSLSGIFKLSISLYPRDPGSPQLKAIALSQLVKTLAENGTLSGWQQVLSHPIYQLDDEVRDRLAPYLHAFKATCPPRGLDLLRLINDESTGILE